MPQKSLSPHPKRSRRATMRALRQVDVEHQIPSFLTSKKTQETGTLGAKAKSSLPSLQAAESPAIRESAPLFGQDEVSLHTAKKFFQKNKGGCVIIMSKTALIGLIFGLALIGILSFGAGFLSGFSLFQQKENHLETTSWSRTQEKNGPQLSSSDVGKDIQNTIKTAGKIVGLDLSQEDQRYAKEGSQKIPNDANSGGFSIQVRVFRDQRPAMDLAHILKVSGYGSYVVQHGPHKDQTQDLTYHVRLGAYGDYVRANELAQLLKNQGYESATVVLIRKGEERILP